MDFEEAWIKALKHTEIIRSRVQALMTFRDTAVPYIFLSESSVNVGDTAVRTGEILVQKPALILPPNIPQLEGFDFQENSFGDELMNFLFIRGVSLPSMRYNNKTFSLDVFEGKMTEAIRHYQDLLQRQENVHTGLIAGPEDCWQFSLLIFVCSQIARDANGDIRKLLQEYKKKGLL